MRRARLMYLALACAGMAPPAAGQRIDTLAVTVVVPGVVHRQLAVGDGPWSVHVVEVDLRRPDLSIRSAHADDLVRGRETVSGMVHRKTRDTSVVVAAINADFFNLQSGEDESNQVVEGEIFKGVPGMDGRAAATSHVHSQFAVLGNNRPLIGQFAFRGVVQRANGRRLPLDGINYRAGAAGVVLYTSRIGVVTPADSSGATVEIRLRHIRQRGDTAEYRVLTRPAPGGNARLDEGPVLSLPAAVDTARDVPRPGEVIRVRTNLEPAPLGLRTVVGGWPRLVVHGQSIADSVDRLEGPFSRSFSGRNPRTGIGFSRDSATLYLVTVDGRREGSDGMSLAEFAGLMVRLGVYEGLNLDGGGSTAMVIDGQLVNTPSDRNRAGEPVERTVGNALLVVQHRHD